MKIIVLGTGFVGLPHAAVLSEYGHEVYAYDIDENKIAAYQSGDTAAIEHYVNEPGLVSIIRETKDEYLFFTSDISDKVKDADVIFMCVNTPPNKDGSTNMKIYFKAARDLGQMLTERSSSKRLLVVNKSTVPIGTARQLETVLQEADVQNFGVASNPEFLAQGKAVEGSRRPNRVLVGADTEEDFEILRRIYPQFRNHVRIKYIETTPETAEAVKYVSNTLLLTYISFWNGVGARLGENLANVNMDDLKQGVTADERISSWGSYVSNGAGGSCLGKDIQSLIFQLGQVGVDTSLLQSVYGINEHQKSYLIDRAIHEARFDFNQKTVALLGLAFKKHTNDMRDSAALKAVDVLLGKGVKEIRAYDPLAIEAAQNDWFHPDKNHLYERITYHETVGEALRGADVTYISTDWEEFRGLAPMATQILTPPHLIIDGRRMLSNYDELTEAGFSVLPVGGRYVPGDTQEEETDSVPEAVQS